MRSAQTLHTLVNTNDACAASCAVPTEIVRAQVDDDGVGREPREVPAAGVLFTTTGLQGIYERVHADEVFSTKIE